MRIHRTWLTAAVLGGAFFATPALFFATPALAEVGEGDVAPDFTLKDHEGNDVTLSSFKGKKHVLLAFFPQAFTGG